ncbi:aldo/keto reductase [Litoribacter ruber]|uniref:Aldo/keto reductase n=1 Tax=Litoribacter ruber TaxID=702568 RepID=A0AAP2CI78_9BACT|nr:MULTISPECIES: aldo/keto reductase [Litoribacter]MBS9525208.1 aldo/keto reductase [Litoribacter alkaliphilus]MBT0811693.1 aldo/keto reductase [Litoribacter ruber]
MTETNKTHHIIYGCMGLGGSWDDSPLEKENIEEARKAIHAALDCGINTFDHADIYNVGKAELAFGEILKENPGLREMIKIQSKAGISLGTAGGFNTYHSSKEYFIRQIDKSLKNLQTDYLDTFLIHRPDPLMDVEEIAETFDYLKSEGLVKRFGVSNMSTSHIQLLQYYCDMPITANQIQFSLKHAALIEEGLTYNITKFSQNGVGDFLPFSKLHNIEIQAWGALDNGLYLNDNDLEETKAVKRLLEKLAEKYDTNPAAILVAWILRLPYNIKPVIGSTKPQRIQRCAEAAKVNLSREDWYLLYVTARADSLP